MSHSHSSPSAADQIETETKTARASRWIARAALCALIGAALLHPTAMLIMDVSTPAALPSTSHSVREAFSPTHAAMAGFFAVLGVLVGTALHHYLELLRVKTRQEERERLARERLGVIHQMAGAVCHEFGQPLTAIAIHAHKIRGDPGDVAVVQASVQAIASSAERMGGLIHQLQNITADATKPYLGERRIVDLARASHPETLRDSHGPPDASKEPQPVGRPNRD